MFYLLYFTYTMNLLFGYVKQHWFTQEKLIIYAFMSVYISNIQQLILENINQNVMTYFIKNIYYSVVK